MFDYYYSIPREVFKNIFYLGMSKDKENYEEAIKAVNSSFGGGKPSPSLVEIFEDGNCKDLTKNVSKHNASMELYN